MTNRQRLLSALTALTLASAVPSLGQAEEASGPAGGPGEKAAAPGAQQLAQIPRILAQAYPELLEHFRHCLQDGHTTEELSPDPALEYLLRLDARTLGCLVHLRDDRFLVQQAEIY